MINNAVQPEVIMQCRGISKTFETRRGPIQILKDVSFNVRRGQITVISGRTGTGKSTLLGLLGGLDKPSTGEIWLDDQRIDNLSTARWSSIRRKKSAYYFRISICCLPGRLGKMWKLRCCTPASTDSSVMKKSLLCWLNSDCENVWSICPANSASVSSRWWLLPGQ